MSEPMVDSGKQIDSIFPVAMFNDNSQTNRYRVRRASGLSLVSDSSGNNSVLSHAATVVPLVSHPSDDWDGQELLDAQSLSRQVPCDFLCETFKRGLDDWEKNELNHMNWFCGEEPYNNIKYDGLECSDQTVTSRIDRQLCRRASYQGSRQTNRLLHVQSNPESIGTVGTHHSLNYTGTSFEAPLYTPSRSFGSLELWRADSYTSDSIDWEHTYFPYESSTSEKSKSALPDMTYNSQSSTASTHHPNDSYRMSRQDHINANVKPACWRVHPESANIHSAEHHPLVQPTQQRRYRPFPHQQSTDSFFNRNMYEHIAQSPQLPYRKIHSFSTGDTGGSFAAPKLEYGDSADLDCYNHQVPRRTAELPFENFNGQRQTADFSQLTLEELKGIAADVLKVDGDSFLTVVAEHLRMACKPCAFIYTQRQCRNQDKCHFCHDTLHGIIFSKPWKSLYRSARNFVNMKNQNHMLNHGEFN